METKKRYYFWFRPMSDDKYYQSGRTDGYDSLIELREACSFIIDDGRHSYRIYEATIITEVIYKKEGG